MIDVKLYESGNGGDILLNGNDLAKANTFDNMPYLAMFGGNVGFSTPTKRVNNEQNFDFWANDLLFGENKEMQFNSKTEFVLTSASLNSRGRQLIQEAVKTDLQFMVPFANIDVVVDILGQEKLSIGISLIQPENQTEKKFMYIWDGVSLIDEELIYVGKPNEVIGLDEPLEFEI